MYTKTATLVLFALIAASHAAPLYNRLSWSYAQRDALSGRNAASCTESWTSSDLPLMTENDCANKDGATGFRAGSSSMRTACSVPVQGGQKKGMCYLGNGVALDAQRRSPQDDGSAHGFGSFDDDGKPEPDSAPDANEPGEESSPCLEQGSPGSPDQEIPPQAPTLTSTVVPTPTPTATSSATPSVTDALAPPNAQVPHHPLPPPPPQHSDNSLTWLGHSIFKMLGGLF